MKKLAFIMLAAVSLLATAGIASAQYYYGGGYYYPYYRDGYPGQFYRRYYHGGYYRGLGYGYRGAIIGYNSWGQREVWYQVSRSGGGPRGDTIQNGGRQLYRGYLIFFRGKAAAVGALYWACASIFFLRIQQAVCSERGAQ